MSRFIYGYVLCMTVVSSVLPACAGESNGSPGPTVPTTTPAPTVCATFYADAHLKGATLVSMGPADKSPTVPSTFNDVMSSVAITPGCTAMVYADGEFGGLEVTFTQTTEAVPATINDQMSSYQCTCGGKQYQEDV